MREGVKVFGIDIIRGSVRSRSRRPLYALVVHEAGRITAEYSVSTFRLFRMLQREQPVVLAVDSLQEIAEDQHALYQFLQSLPPDLRVIQVTGGERKESLGKVAARYNISFDRFDPFDEARTIAKVASLGAGAEVIAFENESEVVVSRHRSPGKGGWSQNRYVRKIHGAVQLKAREVEFALRSAGLRFQKKETRAFGGCSRVAFHVAAPRRNIPVPAIRNADVQVRITGKRLERIRYQPVAGKPRPVIVGIDPGTTTAVAVLDLDGNVLHLGSSRQTTMAGVTEILLSVGRPVVIASDVAEMPYSVEKIRRAFNATSFTPRQDLPVETKIELCSGFRYGNDHERDALSAAREAHRVIRHRLQSILRRVPPGVDLDEVRAGVIRGQSLEQLLERAIPPVVAPADPSSRAVPAAHDERVRLLDGTVKRLRTYVQELQSAVRERDETIHRLQGRLRRVRSSSEEKIRRENEIVKRDAQIHSLKKSLRHEERRNRALARQISRLRQVDEIQTDAESVPVKVMPALTRDGVRALSAELGIRKGDMVYVQRLDGWGRSAVREIAEAGAGALILPGDAGTPDPLIREACQEAGLPLIPSIGLGILIRGKFGVVPVATIQAALREWEAGQARLEREQRTAMVEAIFREYRTERGREMKRSG